MNITRINPDNAKETKAFIDLPFSIYQGVPQWVPPQSTDIRRIFDRRRNPFYRSGEAESLAAQMLWFADPKLIEIVMKDDKPIGFLFAYPDVSAAVQKIKGKVFPFGWIHLLLELRRTKWININGAAMVEGHRGSGGTALLFSEMYKSVINSRYKYADIVQMGVENEKMQREMADLGIKFHKKHRVYSRAIV